VRNALVAIDTGQAGLESFLHNFRSHLFLLVRIHSRHRVTIAALVRIVRLHGSPDMLREFEPVSFEFFGGVDGA